MAVTVAKSEVPVVQALQCSAGGDISGGAGADVKGQCAGVDIIQAIPLSADDFTTWSSDNRSGVPWTQVTLDKDSQTTSTNRCFSLQNSQAWAASSCRGAELQQKHSSSTWGGCASRTQGIHGHVSCFLSIWCQDSAQE